MDTMKGSVPVGCTCRVARRIISAVLWIAVFAAVQGCGIGQVGSPLVGLSPASSTVPVGSRIAFNTTGVPMGSTCVWQSSDKKVLTSFGNGSFRANAQGSAMAVAQCNEGTSVAATVVVTELSAGPIVITSGGTYSGSWSSNDPAVPAVSIQTDQPVILRNSNITGRGDLIDVNGTGTGAKVTIEDTTGTALDPGVAGMQRGSFLSAQNVYSLQVKHCSMYGVSFGVKVQSSTVSALAITQNLASQLEDRASDGVGGLQATRPSLGHFIFLYEVSAQKVQRLAGIRW